MRLLCVFLLISLPPLAVASTAVSVGVAQVVQGELADEVTLVGSAIARRSSQISAQVDGLVETMRVDRGSAVRRGDELFHLDDALARYDLASARAQLAQAEAELKDARRKLGEAERLRAQGHIPQSALETAETTALVAQSRRDERRAQVGRSETLLTRHVVRAPFNGFVVARGANEGQWIRSDSQVLTLLETDPARVEVPVPERVYAQIRKGAQAMVRFESLPGEAFTAQVGALVPQGVAGARTFPVWFDVENELGRIAPGMSARVTLALSDQPQRVLMVPNDSLVRRADGSTLVWLVREDASADGDLLAQAVRVEVGQARGALRQVEGPGIVAGDLVVVRGNEGLRPNQRVRISSGAAGG